MLCKSTLNNVAALVLLISTVGAAAPEQVYTFSLDGESINPAHYSLDADRSDIKPGDVIRVSSAALRHKPMFLTLGTERDCRFVTKHHDTEYVDASSSPRPSPPVPDGRLFRETEAGEREVVGVIVMWTYDRKAIQPPPGESQSEQAKAKKYSFEKVIVNPLEDMSPSEIKGLWGIYLDYWPEGIEERLSHVDPSRVCITVTDGAALTEGKSSIIRHGEKASFPPLPSALRYLNVERLNHPGMSDFSAMARFDELVFLKFRSIAKEALDAGLVARNRNLRYLALSGTRLANTDELSSLTELRYLNLSGCRGVTSVQCASAMPELRVLSLGRTAVSSLSPLDNCRSIRAVYANSSAVSELPKGPLSALATLDIVSTRIDSKTVNNFRRTHPHCSVRSGWTDSFRRAVTDATRLRVRSGGTCHRQIELEKTLAEVTDIDEIARVVAGIEIDEDKSGGICMCCGSPTLEFYRGEQLIAEVGYHHAESLRWAGGAWPADARLSPQSTDFLTSWLADHGVTGPLREHQRKIEKAKKEQQRRDRLTQLIPRDTLAAVIAAANDPNVSWRSDSSGRKRRALMAEAFKKHETDAVTSVELYLRMLGCPSEWNTWDSYDYEDPILVDHLLPRFKGKALAQGVRNVVNDEEGLRGAARWLLGEGGWSNLDESDRNAILDMVTEWSLAHEHSSARKKTINVLGKIDDPWSIRLLRGVLRGEPARRQPANGPESGSGSRIDFGDGDRLWSNEYSDAACAALCLAKLNDKASLPVIEDLAEKSDGKNRELLEKAVKLLRQKKQADGNR